MTLQLLPPAYGAVPDTADALDVGYTAQTRWSNADGSAPSYLWKPADSDLADAFTADQAYQAEVRLSPISGYRFAQELTVRVTNGKNPPTLYTPAQVETNGEDRVVTMLYDKTEHREAVSALTVAAPPSVGLMGTVPLTVSYYNNRLADPATFTYQWYRCGDADGGGRTPIPGATGREYTVPAGDTQTPGSLYYCCELTALGKGYLSPAAAIEVGDALDPNALPAIGMDAQPVVQDGGQWAEGTLQNLLRHKDVSYQVTLSAQVKTLQGTALGSSGIATVTLTADEVAEDGSAAYRVDLADLVGGYVSLMMERDMAYSYDLTVEELAVTVTPQIRQEPLEDRAQTAVHDLSGKANFYLHNAQSSDQSWQGPPRDMRLVIQNPQGSPQGTFVDKDDPDRDPVPGEKYSKVMTIFGIKGGDWKNGYDDAWKGTVYVWNDWLAGLDTGASRGEVRCAFYAPGAAGGGMDVYYFKFTAGTLVFDLEND